MSDIYYLLKSGTLSKSSGSIVLKNENETFEIPLENVDMIAAFGNISFTTPALSLLSESKIPVILFSERGWYLTSIFPDNYLQSGYVLKKQVEHSIDSKKKDDLSISICYRCLQKHETSSFKNKVGQIEFLSSQNQFSIINRGINGHRRKYSHRLS